MKSLKNLDNYPASLPLLADDILEFHAARILLLVKYCGIAGRINGLTKMAKLDFFVRYPQFFARIANKKKPGSSNNNHTVESNMVRYHYGPWDQRYYHVLAYLEAKRLMSIDQQGNTFNLALTDLGDLTASQLSQDESFQTLIEQMNAVKEVLGKKTGTQLKKMIYEEFEQEVAQLQLGDVINVE